MTPADNRHPYSSIYPRHYIAYRAPPAQANSGLAISINGDLNKPFWTEVPWTDDFVDIETNTAPKFRTAVKMRWDEEFLYVGKIKLLILVSDSSAILA